MIMMLLMQLKFLFTKINTVFKKHLTTLLPIFFSIFSINNCYAVAVGDSYAGGTVFCVSDTEDTTQCKTEGSGNYGLVIANEDQVNFDSNPQHGITWSTAYSTIPGAQSLDSGVANTAAIIAAFPKDNLSNNAAWLANSYRDREGHTDWYLPSKNELNKIYLYAKANNLIGKGCSGSRPGGVQCLVGGYDGNMYYWSSSEYSGHANYAWHQHFSNGRQTNRNKNYHFAVRAVRAFNDLAIQQFNHSLLGLNQTQLIQKIAENDPRMISIDLSSRGIAGGHTQQLAEVLRANHFIRHIDLRNNALIDEPFNVLIDVIKTHPSLKTVDIAGVNSLSAAVKERLQRVLEEKAKS